MTEETLLPCPFCGHAPTWRKSKVYYDQIHGEPLQNDILGCFSSQCGFKPSICTGSKVATKEIWNTRNNDQALTTQKERLVSEIKFKDCPHDSSAHCWEEDCRIHDVGGYNEAINDVLNLINPPSN